MASFTLMDRIRDFGAQFGLVVRGGFECLEGEDFEEISPKKSMGGLILFGNVGSSLWSSFSQSDEYRDGEANPLDRWSYRVGEMMASEFSGRAFYPFGGPPHRPFISWAKKAEGVQSSRLGMLIHAQYGLWHAYRFALGIDKSSAQEIDWAQVTQASQMSPCERCVDQPCLSACPVGAFSISGYDVDACYAAIDGIDELHCMGNGCGARRVCPYGRDHHYLPEHAEFHMVQFLRSLRSR